MKRLSTILFLISIFANIAFGQTSKPAQQKERERWPDGTYKWTTDVSVAIRGFGPVLRVPGSNISWPAAVPSPDGRFFHVVSARGDLTCKCVAAELLVYDTQVVRRWLAGDEASPPIPLRSVPMSTRGARGEALHDVVWNTDTSLVFIGRDEADMEQYYRLDVPSGTLRALTKETASSRMRALYAKYVQGQTVLFQLDLRTPPVVPEASAANAAPLTVAAPRNAAGSIQVVKPAGGRAEWGAVHGNGEPWKLPIGGIYDIRASFASSDGHRALLVPDIEGTDPSYTPDRFVLVDFSRRKMQVLGEVAPGGRAAQLALPGRPVSPVAGRALWTADGSEAILINTKLPTGQAPAGAPPDAGYITAYEVATGRFRVIEVLKDKPIPNEARIRMIGWLEGGKELLVAREVGGKPVEGTVYTRSGENWVGRTAPASINLPPAQKPKQASLPDGLKISVRQSANDPPVLVASDGTREKAMFGPDPALQGVGIARVEPYKWRLPDGTEQSGLLTLPRDFVKGNKPLPLVIQNGTIRSDVFLPDGSLPTGYARQALVSQGFAVLEVGLKRPVDENGVPDPAGGPAEGPGFVAQIDAAVEALARDGIVDPNRVGALGHSRRGFQVHYAITHPGRVRLAAVEIWDSVVDDFPIYLNAARRSESLNRMYESEYNYTYGGSFWENKASWLKQEVLFNADRVEAATLFIDSGYSFDGNHPRQIFSPETNFSAWMSMGAYQLNRRPMDYMTIPEAGHVIPGALFHKAAMDLNVDWMNFWLQNREDPDPAKAEQYKRWRMIRERNEQRKAEEAKLGKVATNPTTPQSISPAATPTPPAQPRTQNASQTSTQTQGSATASSDEVAIQRVKEELKAAGIPEPQNIFPLNVMAYREMYVEKDMAKAEKLFRWNLILFPNRRGTSMITDSMAEYYLQSGDVEKAIEYYTRSLELKPNFPSKAKQIIQRLKEDPASLGAIQEEQRQDYINFTKSNPGE
jgi:dipeptidyl aminopeptidase/acylaminoacyl peptidase